jgi:hypothetical protein
MTVDMPDELVLKATRLSLGNGEAASLLSDMIYMISKRGKRRDPQLLFDRLEKWHQLVDEDNQGTKRKFSSLIETTASAWDGGR